jgi:hypothetical protein
MNDAIGCNPALIPYLDEGPDIIAAQNHFSEAVAEVKGMRGPPGGFAFTTAIRGLCNAVSQGPQTFVGRALIRGFACQNHIMVICRGSVRRFLGTSGRPVNDHLVHSRVVESRTECSRVRPWTM